MSNKLIEVIHQHLSNETLSLKAIKSVLRNQDPITADEITQYSLKRKNTHIEDIKLTQDSIKTLSNEFETLPDKIKKQFILHYLYEEEDPLLYAQGLVAFDENHLYCISNKIISHKPIFDYDKKETLERKILKIHNEDIINIYEIEQETHSNGTSIYKYRKDDQPYELEQYSDSSYKLYALSEGSSQTRTLISGSDTYEILSVPQVDQNGNPYYQYHKSVKNNPLEYMLYILKQDMFPEVRDQRNIDELIMDNDIKGVLLNLKSLNIQKHTNYILCLKDIVLHPYGNSFMHYAFKDQAILNDPESTDILAKIMQQAKKSYPQHLYEYMHLPNHEGETIYSIVQTLYHSSSNTLIKGKLENIINITPAERRQTNLALQVRDTQSTHRNNIRENESYSAINHFYTEYSVKYGWNKTGDIRSQFSKIVKAAEVLSRKMVEAKEQYKEELQKEELTPKRKKQLNTKISFLEEKITKAVIAYRLLSQCLKDREYKLKASNSPQDFYTVVVMIWNMMRREGPYIKNNTTDKDIKDYKIDFLLDTIYGIATDHGTQEYSHWSEGKCSLGTFNELTEFMNLKFCNLGLVSEESIKNMVHDVITKNVKAHLEEPGFLVLLNEFVTNGYNYNPTKYNQCGITEDNIIENISEEILGLRNIPENRKEIIKQVYRYNDMDKKFKDGVKAGVEKEVRKYIQNCHLLIDWTEINGIGLRDKGFYQKKLSARLDTQYGFLDNEYYIKLFNGAYIPSIDFILQNSELTNKFFSNPELDIFSLCTYEGKVAFALEIYAKHHFKLDNQNNDISKNIAEQVGNNINVPDKWRTAINCTEIIDWNDVAIYSSQSSESLKFLIEAHKDENSNITITKWDEVAIKVARHSPESLKLLIEAHKDENSKITITNWDEVAIKVIWSAPESLKLLIKEHKDETSKITITKWNRVAIKVTWSSPSPELLKLLVEEHKDENSKITITNWDEVAIETNDYPELLKLLIKEHKDENSNIMITKWDEVLIDACYHPKSLKLLIEAHKDENSNITITKWDEVAIKTSPESLKLLIEEHKDKNSKITITNWDEVAIADCCYSESLKLLIEAHKDENSEITITKWDEVAIKVARYSPESLKLLIEEHKDENSKITITKWDEVAIKVARHCPESLKLLVEAHKAQKIKITNWDEVAMEVVTRKPNDDWRKVSESLKLLVEVHKDENSNINIIKWDEVAIKVARHSPELLKLLIEAHKDENSKITITKWDEVAIKVDRHCPESLKLLVEAHKEKNSNINITKWDEVAIKVAQNSPELLKLLIEAHKDENSNINITKWDEVAIKVAQNSPELLKLLVEAHKDENSNINITKWDEVAIKVAQHSPESLKLLIEAHKDENSNINITKWDEVAIKVAQHSPESLKLLIEAHKDENSKITITNWDEVAIKVAQNSLELLKLLVEAHKDENSKITITNWDEVAIKVAQHSPESLKLLIEAHKDENSKITITNWDEVAIKVAQHSPESLKLLIEAHKDENSKITITNWNEVAVQVMNQKNNCSLLELLIEEYNNKDSKIKINWNEMAIKVADMALDRHDPYLLKVLIAMYNNQNFTKINPIDWNDMAINASNHPESLKLLVEAHKDQNSNIKITNWDEVAIATSNYSEPLKLLIEAHKDENSKITITKWDEVAIKAAFYCSKSLTLLIEAYKDESSNIKITNWNKVAIYAGSSHKSLALLIKEHKDENSKITITNWDEVAIQVAMYHPKSLKLLIEAHKDESSNITITNWDKMAIETRNYPKLLKLLIEAHKDEHSKITITNWDEVAIKVDRYCTESLKILIKAHKDESSNIKLTNWNDVAKSAGGTHKSLKLLIKAHKDENSKITITKWDEVAIEIVNKYSDTPKSLELLIQAYKASEIDITNWDEVAVQVMNQKNNRSLLALLVEEYNNKDSKIKINWNEVTIKVADMALNRHDPYLLKQLIAMYNNQNFTKINAINWNDMAIKVVDIDFCDKSFTLNRLKLLIEAHANEDSNIEITNWNEVVSRAFLESSSLLELLTEAHKAQQIKINWNEVAIKAADMVLHRHCHDPDLLKDLITMYNNKNFTKINAINWNDVAIKVIDICRYDELFTLNCLIEAHENKNSNIEITNWNVVVSRADLQSPHVLELLIEAHKAQKIKINWGDMAITGLFDFQLLERLIKEHKEIVNWNDVRKAYELCTSLLDYLKLAAVAVKTIIKIATSISYTTPIAPKITITNWDEIVMAASQHPKSLDLLIKEHEDKRSPIKITSSEALALIAKHKDPKIVVKDPKIVVDETIDFNDVDKNMEHTHNNGGKMVSSYCLKSKTPDNEQAL